MPNHVINELIFRVPAVDQERVLAAATGPSGVVDFEVLLPSPLNIWWGNVGCNHEAAFKRTALDWSRDNWGTKWNAYGHKPIERTADTLTLRFQTAWSAPYPWLAAVFNKTQQPFEHNWMDEGGPSRSGRFEIAEDHPLERIRWSEQEPTPEMARHLHLLLWGVETFDDEPEEGVATTPTADGEASNSGEADGVRPNPNLPPALLKGEPE